MAKNVHADRAPAVTSPSRVEVTAPSIDTLLARDEVLLLAHAGGNLDAPQETLYAYRHAADAGSDALELDVMLTADRVLVVHHDDTVDRLTNGVGAIADMTLAAVQSLDAAHWFIAWDSSSHDRPAADYELRGIRTGEIAPPPGFSADDFRIPTFREVALAFPHLPLDVEVKGTGAAAAGAVQVLAAELEELDRVDSTVVVSFDSVTVELMGRRLPAVALSPGLDTLAAWVRSNDPLGDYAAIQIPPFHEGIELIPVMLDRAHAEGIAVWIWPDDPRRESTEYYQELIDTGVDGVIAGSPSRWPR